MIYQAIRNSVSFGIVIMKWLVVLILTVDLVLSPRGMTALAAAASTTENKPRTASQESSSTGASTSASSKSASPARKDGNAPQKDRKISLRPLDLSRPPSEAELRMAGQLGSPLSPSASADPTGIGDPAKRKKQEDDNLLFGQAIQKWNQHEYPEAIKLFRQHRETHADSPWAGEAELHLGCAAQFSGSWEEAKTSFEWILDNHQKGTDIYQKAKLRRSVLYMDQGQLEEATQSFVEMLESETDWERRTYAHSWIRQLNLYKGHEIALRDCGTKTLSYVLRHKGQSRKAERVVKTAAPSTRGFSLGELADLGSKLGLKPRAVRSNVKELSQLSLPFIAHYSDQHFVVVTGFGKNNSVRLFDPRLDRPTELTQDQFDAQWSGLALIFGGRPKNVKLATAMDLTREMGGCCGIPRYPNDLGPTGPVDCNGMPGWQVNPVNMNLVMQDVPMWYDSEIGPKISIEITYNSQDSLNQLRPFGNKWIFNYASYAMESPGGAPAGSVLIVMPGGRGDTYQPDGTGGYVSPAGVFSKLTKLSAYTFDLAMIDGTTYHYGVPPQMTGFSSLLLSIEDRNHNLVTINHDSTGAITGVADAQSRLWTMTYTGSVVTSVTDPFGRTALFSYDSNNNLIGQTDMGGLSYSYTYDSNVYLTSVTKPAGTTSFYIEPPGLPNSTNPYPPPGAWMWEDYRVTITDPFGYAEEYYYCGDGRYGWFRDKNQYQYGGSWSQDRALNGPKTRYDYSLVNGKGVVSKVTYADGKTLTYSNFNSALQPQTITDENSHATQLTYNSMGRVVLTTRS